MRLSNVCPMLLAACTGVLFALASWSSPATLTWLVLADHPESSEVRAAVIRSGAVLTREIPAIGVYTVAGDLEAGKRLARMPGIETVPSAADIARSERSSSQGTISRRPLRLLPIKEVCIGK
jgi:hypothetical protein